MQFGFTLKPDHTIERTIALTRQAEAAGLRLRLDLRQPRPLARSLSAAHADGAGHDPPPTRDVRDQPGDPRAVGHGVHPGRARRAVGRPDGPRHRSRRLRPPGARQATDDDGHARGGDHASSRRSSRAGPSASRARTWSCRGRASGRCPSGSRATARWRSRWPAASPTVSSSSSPTPTSSAGSSTRSARRADAAGRAPDSILIQSAAAAYIGPREVGRERTRWFPALVSNHVVDLVNKYPREELPASLTGYIRDREGYDYLHHAEVGSSNAAFVGDDVTDRFCVLGTADEHVAKLHELAAAGVDQFNVYLMNGDEEAAARGLRPGRDPGLRLARAERPGTIVRLVKRRRRAEDAGRTALRRPERGRPTAMSPGRTDVRTTSHARPVVGRWHWRPEDPSPGPDRKLHRIQHRHRRVRRDRGPVAPGPRAARRRARPRAEGHPRTAPAV